MWQYNYGPELYHHGIKGMRWGVRRFQRKDGSLTPAGKKRYSDDDSKAEQSSKKKGLTSNQKKAIAIGTAVVAAALVTYGAYKLGAFEKFKKTGMDAVKGVLEDAIDPNTGFKLQKEPSNSMFSAIKNVNSSGSNTNCRACSIASILRIKGLDVEARGDVAGGSLASAVNKCFKNAKVSEMYAPNKTRVTNYITKRFEEGSSGAMSAEFNLPTGKFQHAINWAVKDGKVSFMDGQKGVEDFSKYLDFLSPDKSAEIVRLDNLEIDPDGIKEFIKNR